MNIKVTLRFLLEKVYTYMFHKFRLGFAAGWRVKCTDDDGFKFFCWFLGLNKAPTYFKLIRNRDIKIGEYKVTFN